MILASLIVWLASPAYARPSDDPAVQEIKRHYDSGLAHFNLQEYPQAIEEFEAASRLPPDPVFLYNLAQAHRLAEHHERALYFYRTFLRSSADPRNRRDRPEGACRGAAQPGAGACRRAARESARAACPAQTRISCGHYACNTATFTCFFRCGTCNTMTLGCLATTVVQSECSSGTCIVNCSGGGGTGTCTSVTCN